ncbi:TM2 domain-containing protein [Altererythrobacter sp. FM1]|uniref:TM2 domain-containing protein n=1 Tax=Tsuneonella flava TaxID=2055955 RepID=UPI000C80C9BA|nr:TM2 domain-containing protein [Tsuneonella flava]ROT94762.1 TM2 domain-containing protein [Altererythrobacter sp. FM1]
MTDERAALASARAQMVYDANKKSAGVAYLLCIVFGGLGAHRFYLGATGTAVAQLVLWFLGWVTVFLAWIPLGIWVLVDLFLIPGMVREKNMAIADSFSFD